jgi:hypothetical protein
MIIEHSGWNREGQGGLEEANHTNLYLDTARGNLAWGEAITTYKKGKAPGNSFASGILFVMIL